MKRILHVAAILLFATTSFAQVSVRIPDYKTLATKPGANYYQLVAEVRSNIKQYEQELTAQGINVARHKPFKELEGQFERWALDWRDRVGVDGSFPDPLTGWINAMNTMPELFQSPSASQGNRVSNVPWTNIGPVNNGNLNGWTYGGGIGRVNVVKRHPQLLGTMFAGTATGGLFRTTDAGNSWSPLTDQFAGLGVSDLVFLPNNSNHLLMATGDFDGSGSLNSIGIFKSTDGGNTWTSKLGFTLNQGRKIAHLYVDPDYATNNTIWATSTFDIYKSTDQGETWTSAYNNGSNENFNDFIKVGTSYFASGLFGSLFKSTDGTNWNQVYNHNNNASSRIDFAYSPNTPDILYILTAANPAFSKYTISTNTMAPFTNVTNSVPADDNGNYNSQGSYNQVISANPLDGNDLMIGEFSGKRSTNAGGAWTNHLNGYYTPTGAANWGGGYVHSDIHYIEYIGANADSLLIGNDGGVYLGPVNNTPFAYKESVQGLTCTQSYSISIFDAEPNNVMIGNQDNDGRSRNYVGTTATWYAAQAGDGISTAIHRTNKDIRFLTGTKGSLSYRSDAFTGNFSGQSIGKPADGVFAAPLEMHLTNGNILYGGYDNVYKSTGITPSGDVNTPDNANWVNLNSGLGGKPKFINLSNHPTDATKQRIVAIGDNNVIRKTVDEVNWSTITPPTGVLFNSVYWSRTGETMIATASGYDAGNKVFISTDAGGTWSNISANMANILMVNTIRYEGTDTVFVSTELGVFFAKLNPGGGLQGTGWEKFGTGLPNVKVTDMEISYAKNQLFIASYGRGVWMANIANVVLPVSRMVFSYNTANASNYSLNWKIEADDLVKTVLEKSTDSRNFNSVASFTGREKNNQPSYLVAKENATVYYRLQAVAASGRNTYSQVIALRNDRGSMMVNIYPNPTSDFVNVNSVDKMRAVKIFSLDGVQVTYAQPMNNFYSFDMSLLPKGTYVVQVTDVNGNMSSERVVRR